MSETTKPSVWWHRAGDQFSVANGERPFARCWEPLYDQAALDAAVAAERERCAKLADMQADIYWGAWDEHADPSDQGGALACEMLAGAIRG